MMAAISRMIRVTSCSASHTSCRKVFGFFGGMKFCPKICFLFSRSGAVPGKPVDRVQRGWPGGSSFLELSQVGLATWQRAERGKKQSRELAGTSQEPRMGTWEMPEIPAVV